MANTKMEEILEYLHLRVAQHPPTDTEVAHAIDMSESSTQHMLTVLQQRGYITWEPNLPRTIRLVKTA